MQSDEARESRLNGRPLYHEPAAVTFVRERSGLSMKQLSDMSGVGLSHLSEIEGGTRNAGPHVLVKLATALNCPVVMLERRRPVGEPQPGTQAAGETAA